MYVYLNIFYEVLTILFYHCGCYIVYILDLHDGARVFPVHGVWLVTTPKTTLYYCDHHLTVQWFLGCDMCWYIQ